MDQMSVAIAQYLDLDVARASDVSLEEDTIVAERAPGFTLGRGHGIREFVGVRDDPHAFSATARGGFDHEREADGCGAAVIARRKNGYSRRQGQLLGLEFVAHGGDDV